MAERDQDEFAPADPNSGLIDPIPEKRIARFILERWKNAHCERCYENDWGISPMAQGRSAGLIVPDRNGRFDGPLNGEPYDVRRVIVVTCRNCGNIRFINPSVVERFIDHEDAAG